MRKLSYHTALLELLILLRDHQQMEFSQLLIRSVTFKDILSMLALKLSERSLKLHLSILSYQRQSRWLCVMLKQSLMVMNYSLTLQFPSCLFSLSGLFWISRPRLHCFGSLLQFSLAYLPEPTVHYPLKDQNRAKRRINVGVIAQKSYLIALKVLKKLKNTTASLIWPSTMVLIH